MGVLTFLLRSPSGMALLAVWLANLGIAVLYGGPLQNATISDTWHFFAEGLTLAGYGDVAVPVSQVPPEILRAIGTDGPFSPNDLLFKNEPLLLPFFLGSLYGALHAYVGYGTWLWGIFVMTVLMAGAYLLGKYAFSPRAGWLAALAVGLDWQLVGFGHLLIDDVGFVAFLVLGAGLYYRSQTLQRPRDLFWAGLAFGLSFATKTVFLYMFAPLALGILLQNRRNLRAFLLLAAGFLVVAVPLLIGLQLLFGNPLFPHIARVNQILGTDFLGVHSPADAGTWHIRRVGLVDTFHLLALPLALGLGMAPFVLWGLWRSLRQRKWLLPFWAVSTLGLYVFVLRVYIWPDRYMVHYVPLFLVLGAAGLDRFLERFTAGTPKGRLVPAAVVVLALVSANFAPALGLGSQLWESKGPTVSTLDASKVAAVASSLRPLFLFPEQRFPDNKFADFALYREGKFPLERVHNDSRDWIPPVLAGDVGRPPNPLWLGGVFLVLIAPFLFLVNRRILRFPKFK